MYYLKNKGFKWRYNFFIANILVVIFLISPSSYSQIKTKGIPFIKHYTKEDYKAATQNWSITQNDQNVMFFANSYGILEFDGSYWRLFNIPNNINLRIVKSSADRKLYVGGQGTVGYFSPDSSGNFKYYSLLNRLKPLGQKISDVWNIFFIKDQIIIYTNEGLFVLGKKTSFFKSDQLYANAFQIGEKIYCSDLKKGMQVFDGNQLKGIPDSLAFANLNVTSMFEIEKDRILIATHRDGLFIYENNKLSPWQNKANSFFKLNQIYCGIKLSVKNQNSSYPYTDYYAFGTVQNGLLIIDKEGNVVQHLNKEKGLQNNTVLNIFYDSDNNLWLALDNGIDFIEITSPFSIFSDATGFPGTIYALEFQNDKIFVGTNQGVFVKSRSEIDNVLQYNSNVTLLKGTEGQVWSFFNYNKSLFCAHHEGIFELSEKHADKVVPVKGAWGFMSILDNQLLVGHYSGIGVLNLKENSSSSGFFQKINGFDESSRIIEIDEKDSSLWIAHGYKGIFHVFLDKQKRNVVKSVFYGQSKGLPSFMLNSVFKINGEIIFGTQNGVYYYDAKQDTFLLHPLFLKYLGKGQLIRKMFEDRFGNIWLSINNEIGVLIKNADDSYTFQTNQFKRIRGRLVDGFELIKVLDKENVFFGTYDGLIHYSPQIVKETNKDFYTLIRKVSFISDHKQTNFRGYTIKGLEKSDMYKCIANYSQNSVNFLYSATFFEDCSHNEYSYKLEGYDKDWSSPTNKTEKEYTNLPEGEYRFLVFAKNIYNMQSDTAQYRFQILPPWHRSRVAYGFYIVIFLIVAAIISYYIHLRFRIQHKILQEEKRKAVAEKVNVFKKVVESSEKEIVKLRNEMLETENARKNTELASFAMQMMQKNEMLELLRIKLNEVVKTSDKATKTQLEELIQQIEKESNISEDDEKFDKYFDEVHNQFLNRLAKKYPELSPKEIKMCAFLRMNLSSKEIAPLLKISIAGVEKSRYRIRKKLNLLKEENLIDYLLKF